MQYTDIQPGDHLFYSYGTHSHHGIYCGDISYRNRRYKEVVIHFEANKQIKMLAYDKFAQNREIHILQYKEWACLAPETVIARAKNRLGEDKYNLFQNNCEHFAHWCKTGKSASDQVNNAIGILGGMGGGLLGALAAGAFLPLAAPVVVELGVVMAAGGIGGGIGGLAQSFMDSAAYKDVERITRGRKRSSLD